MGSKVIRNVTKILKATSGRLFGRVTSGTGRGEELTPSDVRTLIAFDESVDDRVAALLAAGSNITITYNDASNTLTIASTAGGLSGTGDVDNAVLRADGTGGATLQSSAWIIADNLTASPNNTVNHACLEATGGTTNVSVSIKPKGSGAFCLSAPDGTATGGNVRGANAVDLQTSRIAASQVASGVSSTLIGGTNGTASGARSVSIGGGTATASSAIAIGTNGESGAASVASGARSPIAMAGGSATGTYDPISIGYSTTATGTYSSIAIGSQCQATGDNTAVAIGQGSVASGTLSLALGNGSKADRERQFAWAVGYFGAVGDAQKVAFGLFVKTTNATPTTLYSNGTSARLTIPSGKIMFCNVLISGIKSDGSAAACYMRKLAIKNLGGTTSLVGSVETIGTDIEDNASTDVAITADNTNDALQIDVTGITGETWRWIAVVEGIEIAYGT